MIHHTERKNYTASHKTYSQRNNRLKFKESKATTKYKQDTKIDTCYEYPLGSILSDYSYETFEHVLNTVCHDTCTYFLFFLFGGSIV